MTAGTRSLLKELDRRGPDWTVAVAVLGGLVYATNWGFLPVETPWIDGLGAGLFAGLAGWTAWQRRGSRPEGATKRGRSSSGEGLESVRGGDVSLAVGLAATVAAFFAARAMGELGLHGMPVVFLVVAVLAALQETRRAVGSIGAAVCLVWAPWLVGWEMAVWGGAAAPVAGGGEGLPVARMALRTGLLAAFGAFGHFVQGRQLWRARRLEEREAERHREELLEQAREFRLLNAGRTAADEEGREDFAIIDAVDAVRQGVYERLSLLKTALDAHTCVLLWFDVGGDILRIRELASDSDDLVEGQIDPAKGVVGSIGRCREPVNLSDMRHGSRGVTYYRRRVSIEQFMGVPLLEDGHIRGILCVDRMQGGPFEDDEQAVVEEVGESILRTVQNERLFRSVEETKFELGQFFKASRRLNSVLTLQDVLEVALRSVSDVVACDFAAVTLCEEDGRAHRVAITRATEALAERAERWEGVSFEANSGLVSMAVKNQHYLPYGGRVREGETVVFTREQSVEELDSLLVLPLIARDRAIGTLVVGARSAGGFGAGRREMLEVIANQVAVSLQNARLYARMEELATTDELTGLPNRRTFERRLDEAIARHSRADRSFGLLLMDIDHFKAVNDTHGHAAGDAVLERVARVLRESVREVDTPARWGGEEFVFILEETRLEEAMVAAERIRRNVAALEFRGPSGPFGCTVSLGAAIWPEDTDGRDVLLERADQALYASKENGRDQVTAWRRLE